MGNGKVRVTEYRNTNNGWQPVVEVDGHLLTLEDAVKYLCSKLVPVRYQPDGSGSYTAIMHDPLVDPTLDEVVEQILDIFERIKHE